MGGLRRGGRDSKRRGSLRVFEPESPGQRRTSTSGGCGRYEVASNLERATGASAVCIAPANRRASVPPPDTQRVDVRLRPTAHDWGWLLSIGCPAVPLDNSWSHEMLSETAETATDILR
jgi:hypothetical protein